MTTLTSLVAAVRAALPQLDMDDEHLTDLIRTAKTPKGAIWIVKRATGPAAPPESTIEGRWNTALYCLKKLAEMGDERAQHMVDVYFAESDSEQTEH